ncbi:WXG100 family type VII secretion target [Mycobacterium simiae]|uniref:ESAT-6-like protein n=1 Tax=Mycobacterium simiae TaxID=1784 RepID=A0A5B1AY98_MYCSI|nr:WXG100 family type VII secretion target [Mycobacterium simiae]KAA1241032.1 WXG100 family type VII secretion target [Mycobacterium simiae]
MATRFMTDPHAMRDMAARFAAHADAVEGASVRMMASAQDISGAGWSGLAQATSLDTMGQMHQAFRNIVNMLHEVSGGLNRDAQNYEQQEQTSRQILSS